MLIMAGEGAAEHCTSLVNFLVLTQWLKKFKIASASEVSRKAICFNS